MFLLSDNSFDVSLRVESAHVNDVNTDAYGSDGFVFHAYNLSYPYKPVVVSVYPAASSHSLDVFIQFDEQPTSDSYASHTTVTTCTCRSYM